MADAKFQVGQTIFAETGSRHVAELAEHRITAVGRKWISFGHSRFDKETMVIDNGGIGYTRRVWTTREEYEDRRARRQAWDNFRRTIDRLYTAPDHLTVDQIGEMSAAIRAPETPHAE